MSFMHNSFALSKHYTVPALYHIELCLLLYRLKTKLLKYSSNTLFICQNNICYIVQSFSTRVFWTFEHYLNAIIHPFYSHMYHFKKLNWFSGTFDVHPSHLKLTKVDFTLLGDKYSFKMSLNCDFTNNECMQV